MKIQDEDTWEYTRKLKETRCNLDLYGLPACCGIQELCGLQRPDFSNDFLVTKLIRHYGRTLRDDSKGSILSKNYFLGIVHPFYILSDGRVDGNAIPGIRDFIRKNKLGKLQITPYMRNPTGSQTLKAALWTISPAGVWEYFYENYLSQGKM